MTLDPNKLDCKCGGKAHWVESGTMVDQLQCDSCGRQTSPYFDGREYAISEWHTGKSPWASSKHD